VKKFAVFQGPCASSFRNLGHAFSKRHHLPLFRTSAGRIAQPLSPQCGTRTVRSECNLKSALSTATAFAFASASFHTFAPANFGPPIPATFPSSHRVFADQIAPRASAQLALNLSTQTKILCFESHTIRHLGFLPARHVRLEIIQPSAPAHTSLRQPKEYGGSYA
jgi:hypothetical protein